MKTILIRIDEKTYEEIHKTMGYEIKNDKDITVFRLFEGNSKAQWYRELLRAGLQKKLMDLTDKEKEIVGD